MPHNPLQDRHMPLTSLKSGTSFEPIADVAGLIVQIVNVYFVGRPDNPTEWVLVDAGMPNSRKQIVQAAEARYGKQARPRAIVLTHGHFDHIGSAVELAEYWDVPVYAHPEEMPFLTGERHYPYPEPQVEGGLVARLSRFFPSQPIELRPRIETLPEDGSVPAMPGWRWIHTPGHTPGHVSFFRETDRAMIVGDAFVTVRQDELYEVLTQHQELNGPPRYFTADWDAARDSVRRLAALEPSVAMTGHGLPMEGKALSIGLKTLADDFDQLARPRGTRH